MAQLRLPITGSGPSFTAVVTVPGPVLESIKLSGQALPPKLLARAVIDTGSDMTAVTASFLQPLGLTSTVSSKTHTASGSVEVRIFEICLLVPSVDPAVFLVVRPQLRVMELTAAIPDVDLLLGRDVLDECLFFYDGPGKQFILAS